MGAGCNNKGPMLVVIREIPDSIAIRAGIRQKPSRESASPEISAPNMICIAPITEEKALDRKSGINILPVHFKGFG